MQLSLRYLLPLILLLQATEVIGFTPAELKFVTIPAGEFIMGNSNIAEAVAEMPDPDRSLIMDETPAHRVVFESSFLLLKTEVTQHTWFEVMATRPGPDEHWQHTQWQELPVVSVSWNDTLQFISRLNQLSDHYTYRLPTEAEWEYAARAGNTDFRPFALLDMDQYAWYLHSSHDKIQPVARLSANPWGLHDMLGNAWEWVSDWYHPDSYSTSRLISPTGPKEGTKKVRRGGSYHCPPHLIRPGYRAADLPSKAYSVLGFRLIAMPR